MTGGRVVVLGPTGRNFAAGMSGGLAFVLDEDGTFRARVNPTMLDQLEELDEADAIEVRALVDRARRAHRLAGRASACSTTGTTLLPKFVKVFPADYKRVLAELRAEEERRAAPSTRRRAARAGGRGRWVSSAPS